MVYDEDEHTMMDDDLVMYEHVRCKMYDNDEYGDVCMIMVMYGVWCMTIMFGDDVVDDVRWWW